MPSVHSILIIDDEPLLLRSMALILQRARYRVAMAGSAREARRQFQADPFDLIFLDLKMPEVDGLTLLGEIRVRQPNIPVFILTAHASAKLEEDATRQGARGYLLKPITPQALLRQVREVLADEQPPAAA